MHRCVCFVQLHLRGGVLVFLWVASTALPDWPMKDGMEKMRIVCRCVCIFLAVSTLLAAPPKIEAQLSQQVASAVCLYVYS